MQFGFAREDFRYKVFALAGLVCMSIQMVFSIVSAVLVKLGLKACVQVKGYSRVLVTGGAGFVVFQWVEKLLRL
jgi:hypothetical protein